MILLDWLIVLVFLVLVALGGVHVSALSLACLVVVIVISRALLKGERL